jgi:serine/threonine-protein kinase
MGVPERIGRYQILGELGQGAMGTVFRGRDEMLDRDVAVKVMSRGLADPDARARFLREARAAARLQHPNIVVIYELGEHEGAPFMALELLEGVDLQRAIDSGIRPDPRATLPVVLHLLAGLAHAHEHGIVHRDVKPSNVFLPFGRPAKIMDFGVARLGGLSTTTSGVVVGTASYMSPEQASAGEIDGRSDLFSAGLILYELVTGEKAYKADSIVAMIYKILHEPPDLSLIPQGRGWERLQAVLTRALARRPEDRYPDAHAMSAEVGQALAELGGTVDLSAPADQALLVRPRPAPRPVPTIEAALPVAPPAAARPRAGLPTGASPTRRSPLAAGLVGAALVALVATFSWLWIRPSTTARPTPTPLPSPTGAASPEPPAPTHAPTPLPTAAALAPTVVRPAPAAPQRPEPATATTPAAAPGLDTEARLLRADDLVKAGRWAEALAEARAALEAEPTNPQATAIAQQAEAEVVIEECLRNARAALREGDRERALDEVRRGFLIRRNDPRLLAMHREAVQQ